VELEMDERGERKKIKLNFTAHYTAPLLSLFLTILRLIILFLGLHSCNVYAFTNVFTFLPPGFLFELISAEKSHIKQHEFHVGPDCFMLVRAGLVLV